MSIHKHTCIHIYLLTIIVFYRRFIFNVSVCVSVRICVWVWAHGHMGTWVSREFRRERTSDPLKLELQVVVSHLRGADPQSGPLEEQQALLTVESFLQLLYVILNGVFVCMCVCFVGWLVWGMRIRLSLMCAEHVSYLLATPSSPWDHLTHAFWLFFFTC